MKQSPSEKLHISLGQQQVGDDTLVPKTGITSKGPRVLGVSYLTLTMVGVVEAAGPNRVFEAKAPSCLRCKEPSPASAM